MRIATTLTTLMLGAALAVPATASAAVTHAVRRGETLTSIAAADGLSVAQLATANGMSTSTPLGAGTQLVIPPQGAPSAAVAPVEAPTQPASAGQAAAPSGGYRVARGDTLSAIAARYGTTPAALASANGLSLSGLLIAGTTLTVPGSAAEAVATPSTVAAPASGDGTPAAVPTSPVFVTPSQVGEIAEQEGVSPSLAEAVADQESGFDDAEISSTGARGVMQIEPGTWEQLNVAASGDPAVDNIEGGVQLLRSLLSQTGGDESEAIAGYYQGLQSVQRHGMFADTQRYVDDVLALQSRYGG